MWSPGRYFLLMQNCSGSYFDDIHDRIPLSVKLADLLVVDFQQHGDREILPSSLGMHRSKLKRTSRDRVEDAHQCALSVAIADVKDLHVRSLSQFLLVPKHHFRK